MRIRVEIPGSDIGSFDIQGDFATEDSLKKLLDVMEDRIRDDQVNTDELQDNLDDAADNLDEFSDELERAEKSQRKLTKRIEEFGSKTLDSVQSMSRAAESGMDFSDVVRTVGDVAAGAADGLASIVPVVGPMIGKLASGAIQAGSALTAMAISSAESFIGLNKSIFNAGLQVEGGFGAFAEFATDARIPVNEFANAMMQSSDRLRLFASGAPGGIGQISSALTRMVDDDTMENLYSLGFTTEEVVAGMADYALAAQRQGRSLSTAELAEGAESYLKNLRELSRLTGDDVKSIQQKINADRANLFVQNQLLKVAPAQRDAAAAFAGAIPDALQPIKDFIITGKSFTAESGLMADQMGTFAGIYRGIYQQVESGALTADQARARLDEQLEANAGQIEQELDATTRLLGAAPLSIMTQAEGIGEALRTAREMIGASVATEDSGGTEVPADSLGETLGKLEVNINQVNSAIQDTLKDSLEAGAGLIGNVADAIGDGATKVNEFRETIGEMLTGNFASFNEMLGTSAEAGNSMWENLENAVAAAIERGIQNAFGGTLIGSMLGINDEKSLEEQLKEQNDIIERSRRELESGNLNNRETRNRTIAIRQAESRIAELENQIQSQKDAEFAASDLGQSIETGQYQRPEVIEQRNLTIEADDPDPLLAREANLQRARRLDAMADSAVLGRVSSTDRELQNLEQTLNQLVSQQSEFSRKERRSDDYQELLEKIEAVKQQIKTENSNEGFRDGGIASGPLSGYETTLHGTEAVVPLPDNRAIPVDLGSVDTLLEKAKFASDDNRSIPVDIGSVDGFRQNTNSITIADLDSLVQEIKNSNELDLSQVVAVLGDLIDQIALLNTQTTANNEKQTQQNQKTDTLVSLIRNVLDQSMSSNTKMEKFVKAMEESNFINNRNGFSRA